MTDEKPKPQGSPPSEGIKKAHEKFLAAGGKPMQKEETPDSRLHHYEYYLLVDTIPVAFLVSNDGNRYGARRPGDTPGSLKPDVTLISKLEREPIDFTPIGEEEFKQRVRDYVRRPPVKDSQAR